MGCCAYLGAHSADDPHEVLEEEAALVHCGGWNDHTDVVLIFLLQSSEKYRVEELKKF